MYKHAKMKIVKAWPVVISEAADHGKVMKREAKVDFEIITQAEQNEIYNNGGNDVDLLKRVVKGWGDQEFQNDDGTPMLFNEENLVTLLGRPNTLIAFTGAYIAASQGREPARKN